MNASRLKEIVDRIIAAEQQDNVQNMMTSVIAILSNMINQPNQPQFQNEYVSQMNTLRVAMERMRLQFNPMQIKMIEELGLAKFFVDDIYNYISNLTRENPTTPIVVQQNLQELISERQNALDRIRQLSAGLAALGISADDLKPGQAEIGFLLPRSLFNNELDGLLKELKNIDLIIKAFSELATGKVEIIEVKQISSTDPTLFFGLSPATIALIGGAISWALDTWKRIEEIREIRARTARLGLTRTDQVSSLLDDSVKEIIDSRIKEHLALLFDGKEQDDKGRINEQRQHIDWALHIILANIERGMTVEIRILPPPNPTTESEVVVAQDFAKLQQVIPQLSFPKIEGEPMLPLPRPPEK